MSTNAIADIRDIKGLVPLPYGWWWLAVALAAVALGLVAFWLWRRKRATTPTEKVEVLSAYEMAMRALQQLRSENPPVEEFYTRLSDIVRRYLEDQLGLRAPERTTEEFLYEVSGNGALSPQHKELLGAFLQESDLVKFARFRPQSEDTRRAFDAAETFVRETGIAGQASRLSGIGSTSEQTGGTPVLRR